MSKQGAFYQNFHLCRQKKFYWNLLAYASLHCRAFAAIEMQGQILTSLIHWPVSTSSHIEEEASVCIINKDLKIYSLSCYIL